MIPRNQLACLIAVALIAFVASLWITGESVSLRWTSAFGGTVSVTGLAIAAFEHFLWRQPLVIRWLAKRPNLRGQWAVVIRSDFPDPLTGLPLAPITASFNVRQTYSAIHASLETGESTGHLIIAQIVDNGGGALALVATFRNEPRMAVRDRSAIHYGTMRVDVIGPLERPTELRGLYWTDRRTTGELQAQRA